MNLTLPQVEEGADTLLVALTSVLVYVVVTDARSVVVAWLVAAIVPLMVVSLAASAVRVRRRDLAKQAATGRTTA